MSHHLQLEYSYLLECGKSRNLLSVLEVGHVAFWFKHNYHV